MRMSQACFSFPLPHHDRAFQAFLGRITRQTYIPPMSSCTRALSIDIIVDEIIWLSHAGSCKNNRCQNPFSLNPKRCRHHGSHLRALARRILVCKLWAKIGIPQLWASYTRDKNLLSLVSAVHWRDKRRLKKNQSESPDETQPEATIDTSEVSD
jgi:hypothetical protein